MTDSDTGPHHLQGPQKFHSKAKLENNLMLEVSQFFVDRGV